ncbi:hypothetical protein EDC46_0550 [Vespertiliibacter pulmonis]|uniref:Uncharacterized protein n=1 Tax=Vespertiliibacter pulmonis TaxID=1443036 RepID=A0A3N4W9E0_9PAST|nr:hypothetical protein EDC46_0550 [Vespertiliibacter pulmonis]
MGEYNLEWEKVITSWTTLFYILFVINTTCLFIRHIFNVECSFSSATPSHLIANALLPFIRVCMSCVIIIYTKIEKKLNKIG